MIEKPRLKERYEDYKNAYHRLVEALQIEETNDIIIDGTIQRFEFTFELAWKLIKYYLEFAGFQDVKSPRTAIRTAFQEGLITDGDSWIDMMVDRNKTSHIYDEKEAREIYQKIKDNHRERFSNLLKKMGQILSE